MDHIRRIDEFGNTEGRPGQRLLAGEMIKDQVPPTGCAPYDNAANAPLYGSSGANAVSEKKVGNGRSIKSSK